jgi:membrane protease YdiL (CAAX protease family)
MDNDPNNKMAEAIRTLTEHAREIVAGTYANVDRLFALTDKNHNSPEIAELAEAFGMMSVKVEAREFKLEQMIEELRQNQAKLEESNLIRVQMNVIFIYVVLMITVYTFVLGFLSPSFGIIPQVTTSIKGVAARLTEVVALLLVIRLIVKSGLPRQSFGLSLHNWKRSALEALAVSAVAIGALSVFKIFLNAYYPGNFKERELFNFAYFDYTQITYILVAPLQEFITRGTVQGSLQRLFVGKYSTAMAIVVTSFLFGSLHVATSLNLALAALLTGILWGWMYNRQKSLVGVSISHFLIGNVAGLMGYWAFF